MKKRFKNKAVLTFSGSHEAEGSELCCNSQSVLLHDLPNLHLEEGRGVSAASQNCLSVLIKYDLLGTDQTPAYLFSSFSLLDNAHCFCQNTTSSGDCIPAKKFKRFVLITLD